MKPIGRRLAGFLFLPICAASANAAELSASSQSELVAAIDVANGNGEDDVIRLSNSFQVAGTNNNDFGPNAFPVISSRIEIDGRGFGMAMTFASNSDARRFFHVSATGELTLRDMTLTDARLSSETQGGVAIFVNGGRLAVHGVQMNGNRSGALSNPATHAVIYADNAAAPLQLSDCAFVDNLTRLRAILALENSTADIRRCRIEADLSNVADLDGFNFIRLGIGSNLFLEDVEAVNRGTMSFARFLLAQQGNTIKASHLQLDRMVGIRLESGASLTVHDALVNDSPQFVRLVAGSIANLHQIRAHGVALRSDSSSNQLHITSSTLLRGSESLIFQNGSPSAGALTLRNTVADSVSGLNTFSPRTISHNLVGPSILPPDSSDNIIVSNLGFQNLAGPDGVLGTSDDDYRLPRSNLGVDNAEVSALPADEFDVDGDGDVVEPVPLDARFAPRTMGVGLDRGALETAPTLKVTGADSLAVREAMPVLPDVFTIELDGEPADVVLVSLAADAQCQVTPSQLIFFPGLAGVAQATPWNTAQPVEVRAVDDTTFEGNHACQIALAVQSNDPQFNGSGAHFSGRGLVQPNFVRANVIDDDPMTIEVFANGFE